MTLAVLDRAVVASDAGRMTGEQERPDLEVPDRARRRSFTAADELEVLAAHDAAGPGEKGAILRREGACSSHIAGWLRRRVRQVHQHPVGSAELDGECRS